MLLERSANGSSNAVTGPVAGALVRVAGTSSARSDDPSSAAHEPIPTTVTAASGAGRGHPAAAHDAAAAAEDLGGVDVVERGVLGLGGAAQQRAQLVLEDVVAHRVLPSVVVSWVRRAASPREAADLTEPSEMSSRSATACSLRSV